MRGKMRGRERGRTRERDSDSVRERGRENRWCRERETVTVRKKRHMPLKALPVLNSNRSPVGKEQISFLLQLNLEMNSPTYAIKINRSRGSVVICTVKHGLYTTCKVAENSGWHDTNICLVYVQWCVQQPPPLLQ